MSQRIHTQVAVGVVFLVALALGFLGCSGPSAPVEYPGSSAFDSCQEEVKKACLERNGNPTGYDEFNTGCHTPEDTEEGTKYRALKSDEERGEWLESVGCFRDQFASGLK